MVELGARAKVLVSGGPLLEEVVGGQTARRRWMLREPEVAVAAEAPRVSALKQLEEPEEEPAAAM